MVKRLKEIKITHNKNKKEKLNELDINKLTTYNNNKNILIRYNNKPLIIHLSNVKIVNEENEYYVEKDINDNIKNMFNIIKRYIKNNNKNIDVNKLFYNQKLILHLSNYNDYVLNENIYYCDLQIVGFKDIYNTTLKLEILKVDIDKDYIK